eukprot:scaffold24102_cov153-Isochrysis_galbana.AAC.4
MTSGEQCKKSVPRRASEDDTAAMVWCLCGRLLLRAGPAAARAHRRSHRRRRPSPATRQTQTAAGWSVRRRRRRRSRALACAPRCRRGRWGRCALRSCREWSNRHRCRSSRCRASRPSAPAW